MLAVPSPTAVWKQSTGTVMTTANTTTISFLHSLSTSTKKTSKLKQ